MYENIALRKNGILLSERNQLEFKGSIWAIAFLKKNELISFMDLESFTVKQILFFFFFIIHVTFFFLILI